MTITDLINNDTINPVTEQERKELPASWATYEVLKWEGWYISPVGVHGEAPRNESMVFVTIVVINGYVYVPISVQIIKVDPEYAKMVVRVTINKGMKLPEGSSG